MGMDINAYYLFGYDITADVGKLDLDAHDGDLETLADDRSERIPDSIGIDHVDIYGDHEHWFIHISDLSMCVDWHGRNVASQFADHREDGQLVEHMTALNDALEALGIPRRDSVIPSRILALKVY